MLSDTEIRKLIVEGGLKVDPELPDDSYQPVSIDLHLAEDYAQFLPSDNSTFNVIDPTRSIMWEKSRPDVRKRIDGQLLLSSHNFILARTKERVTLDQRHAARVEGKSTLGRCGLAVHITAGFIDPGFDGHITLELFNFTRFPILLVAGMKICQLAIERVQGEIARPYGHPQLGSKYQGQTGVTPPK